MMTTETEQIVTDIEDSSLEDITQPSQTKKPDHLYMPDTVGYPFRRSVLLLSNS